jgi:hypothetical protein
MIRYGTRTYWRFKGDKEWRVGYPARVVKYGLVRMAPYAGAVTAGPVVSVSEIEYK